MILKTPILTVPQSAKNVAKQIRGKLAGEGLQFMQSFDLKNTDNRNLNCVCNYHGSTQCTCQMEIYLIYNTASRPTTLIIHEHAQKTAVGLGHSANHQQDQHIMRIVEETFPPNNMEDMGYEYT